jgi:protein TonB
MQHPQHTRFLPAIRSPQQRLASFVIVAGLHVAVIVAFLFALRATFSPSPPPELHWRFLPQQTSTHEPVIAPRPLKLISPANPQAITPPDLRIEQPPSAGGGQPGPSPQMSGIDNGVVGARAIASTHTIPDYPPLDIRLEHEGNVLLRLVIDERGTVVHAVVERSSGHESLDRAAMNWVMTHWRYEPAMRAGVPVASTTDAIVTFRLTIH